MNTRLSQDAADTLQAYEQQQAWRDRAKRDWQRAQGAAMTGVWSSPPLSAQEQQERKQQIEANVLPF